MHHCNQQPHQHQVQIQKCPVEQAGKEHQPDDICVLRSILDQAILIHQKRGFKEKKKSVRTGRGRKTPLDCLLMFMAASHLSNTASQTLHTLLILSVSAQTNCSCLPCLSWLKTLLQGSGLCFSHHPTVLLGLG